MEKQRISLDAMIGRNTVIHFDSENIYIERNKMHVIVPIIELLALEKTLTVLNNRRFWRLLFVKNQQQESVTFRSNYTFWNKSFKKFHARVSELNPAAVKTEFRWWNL